VAFELRADLLLGLREGGRVGVAADEGRT